MMRKALMFSVLVLALCGGVSASLTSGLVSYWNHNITAVVDVSGGGWTATSTTTLNSTANSVIPNANNFTATSSTAIISNTFPQSASFTFCTWYNPATVTSAWNENTLFARRSQFADSWWTYALAITSNGSISFTTEGNGANSHTVWTPNVGAAATETWHHACMAFNSTGNSKQVWYNGLNVMNATAPAALYYGTAQVPRFHAQANAAYNGRAGTRQDESGFWSYVLTDALISELYNGGTGCGYPFTGCVPSPPPVSNFSITAQNSFNSSFITVFNATVNGTFYSTTNGTIVTDVTNESVNVPVTVRAFGYSDSVLVSVSPATDLVASMNPFRWVTAFDGVNGSSLLAFNVSYTAIGIPNNVDVFDSTTSGLILVTEPDLVGRFVLRSMNYFDANISVGFLGAYPAPVNLNMTPLYSFGGVSYGGFVSSGGSDYVRSLLYNVSYSCPSFGSATLHRVVNGVSQANFSLTCVNSTQVFNGVFTPATEGEFNFSVWFVASLFPELNSVNTSNSSFIADLQDASVVLNLESSEGFVSSAGNVSMQCVDSLFTPLLYNLTLNSNLVFFGNLSNATVQMNATNFTNGVNSLVGRCSDLFGTTQDVLTSNIFSKVLSLIDERNNVPFDVANITRARVYFDDNSSFYQFGGVNGSAVNFTTSESAKLRFELLYSDGTIITRYVDVSLVEDSDVRVCANNEGVTHYEQLAVSVSQQPVVLKNVFSNCLVAADYTRFAYQDAFVLKSFTIPSLYYLYSFSGGSQVVLASIDGSIGSFINIDTLEFTRSATSVNILTDVLSFQSLSNSTVQIYYRNIRNDSTGLNVTILRMDSGAVVFQSTDFTNPNEFTMYFDYSTLSPAVNESVLFKMIVTRTGGASADVLTRYFNNRGKSGVLNSQMAFVISFLLCFFGLSFTVARSTFSWFGLFIVFIAMVLLGFAASTWYTVLLLVVQTIILLYIGIMMWSKNNPVMV